MINNFHNFLFMTLRTFSNIKIRLFLHSQNTVKFRMIQNFLHALVEILQKKILYEIRLHC